MQHVRDYRAQGETAGASALARVYSQLFYDSGHDWLFIFYLYFFFCILYFVFFFFFFLFEDTIEKFRLLKCNFKNLHATYLKLTRNLPDHLAFISLFIKLGTWMHHQE